MPPDPTTLTFIFPDHNLIFSLSYYDEFSERFYETQVCWRCPSYNAFHHCAAIGRLRLHQRRVGLPVITFRKASEAAQLLRGWFVQGVLPSAPATCELLK